MRERWGSSPAFPLNLGWFAAGRPSRSRRWTAGRSSSPGNAAVSMSNPSQTPPCFCTLGGVIFCESVISSRQERPGFLCRGWHNRRDA